MNQGGINTPVDSMTLTSHSATIVKSCKPLDLYQDVLWCTYKFMGRLSYPNTHEKFPQDIKSILIKKQNPTAVFENFTFEI